MKVSVKTKRFFILVLITLALAVILGSAAFGIKMLFSGNKTEQTAKETVAEDTEKSDKRAEIEYKNAIYRDSLTDDEKKVYDSVYRAAVSLSDTSEICECSIDTERFEKIAGFIRADNPMLFYVNFDELVLEVEKDRVYVDMVYSVVKENIPAMQAELESAVSETVAECMCDELENDYEKEIALHDALIQKCVNSKSVDLINNTAYGALVLNEAYCDGYAYAMKLLLERVGIEAYAVYGTADGVGHVWNLVNIDGDYYNLDALWDDANLSFAPNMCFHGYFNLSDEKLSLDHTAEYPGIVPKAVKDYDFYSYTGRKAETVDSATEIFRKELVNSINEGKYYIEIFCEETADDAVLTGCLSDCLSDIYENSDACPIYEYFTVYHASANSNAVTIQFYYK